jgi:hypothetical protein
MSSTHKQPAVSNNKREQHLALLGRLLRNEYDAAHGIALSLATGEQIRDVIDGAIDILGAET